MLTWVEFPNVSTGRPVFIQPEKVTCVIAIDSTTTRLDFDGGSHVVISERYDMVIKKLGAETIRSSEEVVRSDCQAVDNDDLKDIVNDPIIRSACVEKAIELGEASPAVHCVRKDYGIVRYGSQISLRPGPPTMPNHEHWRGQIR